MSSAEVSEVIEDERRRRMREFGFRDNGGVTKLAARLGVTAGCVLDKVNGVIDRKRYLDEKLGGKLARETSWDATFIFSQAEAATYEVGEHAEVLRAGGSWNPRTIEEASGDLITVSFKSEMGRITKKFSDRYVRKCSHTSREERTGSNEGGVRKGVQIEN